MAENTTVLKIIVLGIGAFLGKLCGGVDDWLIALITLISIDYITGVASAFINKQVSSSKGFKGLIKKFVIMLIVVTAVTMDNLMHLDGLLRGAVIVFFICNEGISILENAGKLGIPLPEKLKDVFMQLKETDKINTVVDKILPNKKGNE